MRTGTWILAAVLMGPACPAFGSPSTATVASVTFERVNVFDPSVPGEDIWPFRMANRIHIMTRESVVERELLPPLRSRWDPLKAIETERNLRALGFIRHAEVKAERRADGDIDLRVRTQDSWTLSPQFSAGTEGGEHFFVYGVSEGNLLGYGKSVSLFHAKVGGDSRDELRYGDPRLLGTWHRLTTQFSSNSYGDEAGVRLNRPFFSLDTPYSSDFTWAKVIQDERLYSRAEQTTKFLHSFRTVRADVSARLAGERELVQRASLGINYERSRFQEIDVTRAGTLPEDRTLSGPVFGYSWIQPRYVEKVNIDRMQRIEDYNLGNELSLTAGPMLRSWGSDKDRWVFTAMDQQGVSLGGGRFALAQIGTRGRVHDGRLRNTVLFANLNFFWQPRRTPWNTVVTHLEYNTSRRLDSEKELVLGGDSGLRGYKNNSFTGGRSVLLNIEDRVFWDREILHLIYMGAVAFVDTGAITTEGGAIAAKDFKTDVGFGLRFSPSRSTTGGVLRVDVAYALNDGPGRDRWVATVLAGQAFSLTGSTNRRALRTPDAVLREGSPSARLRRR